MNKRNIIINSTLLFSVAFLVHGTVHELGHFVAATMLGAQEVTLFHNCVQYDTSQLSLSARIWIAAAGPLISLLCGIVFQIVCSRVVKRGLLFLFFLYLSAFGYINFSGYLMMSPFFAGGDTGFICASLELPLWSVILIALGGIALGFLCLKSLCRRFIELASSEFLANPEIRRSFVDSLIQYPLYYGIVVTTLLELPVPGLLSLLYPLCSPFSLLWVYGYLLDTEYPNLRLHESSKQLQVLSPVWIGIFIVNVIINRFLVFGFHI